MNGNIEGKLVQLGELSESLTFTEPTDILEKARKVKQRSKFYFKARVILYSSMILIVALLGGFTFKHYYFRNYQAQQDKGEINIYNAVYNEEGITLNLEAVYSDGLETYAKISADGLSNIPNFNTDAGILNKIKQAYLVDDSGNKWQWRSKDIIKFTGGTIISENTIFDINGLKQTEAVLGFHGAPADGAHISFEFDLNNGEIIKFSDLTIHVVKSVIRDVSNLDLTINIPYAQGKIQKIIYAETRVCSKKQKDVLL